MRQPVPASMGVEEAIERAVMPSMSQLPRVVSLIVLSAVVLLTGVLFFKVMAGFIVPLFLAAVLAVIFEPLHKWSLRKLPSKRYLAALLTTSLISLLVLAPLTWIGWEAFHETRAIVQGIQEGVGQNADPVSQPEGETVAEDAADEPVESSDPLEPEDLSVATTAEEAEQMSTGAESITQRVVSWVRAKLNIEIDVKSLLIAGRELLKNNAVQLGLGTFEALLKAGLGIAIMIFALYYFFADGPVMIKQLMRLSPLEDRYELELLERFAQVSRAVVVATLLSALVQGLLGGVGYWFVLPGGSPIFLLTMLTMLLAIVPFLGATAVWAPVAAWVFFLTPDDAGFWPGLGLAIYGFCIVSSVDNVLKPLVLSGQSNLHPLLALLSVLGGIQFLGPIGILVGPMLVVFMQALLEMLRKEIDDLKTEGGKNAEAEDQQDEPKLQQT